MAAVWLCLAAVVGAIKVAGESPKSEVAAERKANNDPGAGNPNAPDGSASTVVTLPDGSTAVTLPDGSVAPGQPGALAPGTPGAPGTPKNPGPTAPPTPGDRTGVSDTEVKYGVHAPITFGGAPVPLADDPVKGVKGYLQYINERGGINGRKVILDLQDDRYEVQGAATAAKALIEHGNFFISGTLGVDQINVVANEASKKHIPYIAAGGPEQIFKNIGFHQLSVSYDTHVIQLARFIAQDAVLKTKPIGISYLESPYISAVVGIFENEAKRLGLKVVAKQSVQKPTEQTTYGPLLQNFRAAGVKLFVPLQDPITTSRETKECGAGDAVICPWTYTFSDFAHDGDTALLLMGGEWGRQHVKGLSGSCYYLSPTAYDPAKCAAMNQAHDQWVKVYGEDDWVENGQGGASGYQLIYFWVKAMTDAGRDLTRERFVAAMNTYDHYSNLITTPITFAGSSNYAHGAEGMVVYEAQESNKYKQLTDSFVGF